MKKFIFLFINLLIFTGCAVNSAQNKNNTPKLNYLQKSYQNSIQVWKKEQFAKKAAVLILSDKGEVLVKAGDKDAFKYKFLFHNKKIDFFEFAKNNLKNINSNTFKIYKISFDNKIGKIYARKAVNSVEYFFAVFDKDQFERKFRNIEVYGVNKGKISYAQIKGTKYDKTINNELKNLPKNTYSINYRILKLNKYILAVVYRIVVKKRGYANMPIKRVYYLLKKFALPRKGYLTNSCIVLLCDNQKAYCKLYRFFKPEKIEGFKVYQDYEIKPIRKDYSGFIADCNATN